MLRIAIPNKGSLADSSIAILKEAGYRQRTDSRDLILTDVANGVEFTISAHAISLSMLVQVS